METPLHLELNRDPSHIISQPCFFPITTPAQAHANVNANDHHMHMHMQMIAHAHAEVDFKLLKNP